MNRLTRRSLLAYSGAAGGLLLSNNVSKAAPSERVNLCVVGVRGRGMTLARNFAKLPNSQITHVCDVNEARFAASIKTISDIQNTAPKPVRDLRRVLEDKSVDAIVVATPDHWHALATIWACQAGKHVYVEKPISHNLFEGWQMVQAARNYQRAVQVGTQMRSVAHYLEAVEFLRSGRLGRVHMAKAWNSQLRRRVPSVPDGPVPSGLDWDIWQGPAPERPYNDNRYTYGWRWLWDYGNGDMGNDGVHDLDIARWGLGVEYPEQVHCTGSKLQFTDDIQETPDTQIVTFTFPDNKILVYEQRLWSPYNQEGFENGVAFYGNAGYMLIGRRGWKVVEKGNRVVFDRQVEISDLPHLSNFLNAVQSGAELNCEIEQGYRSTLLVHLGNLSYRVARPLRFDAATQTLPDDPEADELLKRRGRKEFIIPDSV